MKTCLIALAALAAAGLARAEATTYAIDPSHTFVSYEVKHAGTSTSRGRFDKKEGTVTIDPAAKSGRVSVSIDLASVDTGVAQLDGHLKSKDFFNVGEMASAKFEGDRFSFDGDKVSAVSGTLTMLGKTVPVTLTATGFNCYDHPMLKRQVCGGDFETTIARSQWGIDYGAKFIPDNVRLQIQVEAIKQ